VVLLGFAAIIVIGNRLAGGRLSLRGQQAGEEQPRTLNIPGVGPMPLFLNPTDPVITGSILKEGIWEASDTHWFVKAVRPGDVVIDAGANIGYYTVLASKLVGPTGRVYAFEPDPTAFEILQRNVRLNGADNVVAEQKALSNANTTLELFIASDNKGDDRIYQPEGEHRPSIKVPAVRVDDYLKGKVDHVDLVKIDTQGAEAVIHRGHGGDDPGEPGDGDDRGVLAVGPGGARLGRSGAAEGAPRGRLPLLQPRPRDLRSREHR